MKRSLSRCVAALLTLGSCLAVVNCGDDDAGGSSGVAGSSSEGGGEAGSASSAEGGAGGAVGGSAAAGAGPAAGAGGEDGGTPVPELNGCTAEDYVDATAPSADRTVRVVGVAYQPRCLKIAAGQSVTWTGSFAAHPLAPGNAQDSDAGSAGNPIEPTASGNEAEFTFEAPGTYAYYCEIHGIGNGQGMSGAIHVE